MHTLVREQPSKNIKSLNRTGYRQGRGTPCVHAESTKERPGKTGRPEGAARTLHTLVLYVV